jgi:hypothetical protein
MSSRVSLRVCLFASPMYITHPFFFIAAPGGTVATRPTQGHIADAMGFAMEWAELWQKLIAFNDDGDCLAFGH